MHRALRTRKLDPKTLLFKIPKIVHFTVADKVKDHQMKVVEYSKKKAESFGFEVMIHRDSDAEALIYSQYHNLVPAWELLKTTTDQTKGARIGDFVRLLLIYHYGGVYLDSDMVTCKDLTPLLGPPGVATFPLVNSVAGGIVNAVFAGPPRHIVFRMALEMQSNNKKLHTQAIIRATGPKQLGDALDAYFEKTHTPRIVKFVEKEQLPEPENDSMWIQSGLIRFGATEGSGIARVRGMGTLGPLGLIHFHFGSWVKDGPRVDHKESQCDSDTDLIEPFLDHACSVGEKYYNRKWSDCGDPDIETKLK